jgi:thiol-disulfide isomerase/thioredoxin
MGHKKAKPRNAQAKPIESHFYHAFEEPLKQRSLPGYSRQDKQDEKHNEFIQAKLREEIKERKLLHAREFFDIVMQVLNEWHRHTLTEEQIQPERCFLEGIQRPLVRYDDAALDFIFLPAAIRQVRNSIVGMTLPGFGKCRWYAPELALLAKRGRKARVEVRFNPYDASFVHCMDPESHALVCTAERWEKTDPHDMDAVSKKIRAQNSLCKHVQNIMRQLAKPETKVHGYTPYAPAVAEIKDIGEAREQATVNDAELNRKLINLAISMGMEPMRKIGG